MKVRSRSFAAVQRVVDGDTVIVVVLCSCCGTYVERRCRIAGMDAPEFDRDGERAVVAMQFLAQLLSRAARVQAVVQRSHPDLYGRWIVELYADGRNVAEVMIAAGYAVRYEDRVVRKGPFSPAVAGRMSHGG